MHGPRLRRARTAWQSRTGTRIPRLIQQLGISKATLFLWERPNGRPDPIDLRRALELYGCAEEEILEILRLRSFATPDASRPSSMAGLSSIDSVAPVSEPSPGLDEDDLPTEHGTPAGCGA